MRMIPELLRQRPASLAHVMLELEDAEPTIPGAEQLPHLEAVTQLGLQLGQGSCPSDLEHISRLTCLTELRVGLPQRDPFQPLHRRQLLNGLAVAAGGLTALTSLHVGMGSGEQLPVKSLVVLTGLQHLQRLQLSVGMRRPAGSSTPSSSSAHSSPGHWGWEDEVREVDGGLQLCRRHMTSLVQLAADLPALQELVLASGRPSPAESAQVDELRGLVQQARPDLAVRYQPAVVPCWGAVTRGIECK